MKALYYRSAALLWTLLFSFSALAQPFLPSDYLSKEFHNGRRQAARALLPEKAVMVVFAAPTRNFANDVDYLYHPDPDLYYFTGYKEPNAVLLIFKEEQKDAAGQPYHELFFVQNRNPQAEQWTGRRLGAEGVAEKLGILSAYPGSDLKNFPLDLSSYQIIGAPLPAGVVDNRRDTADLYDLVAQVRAKVNARDESTAFGGRLYREITGRLREVKTEEELYLLRKAVEISCMGQNEVMKLLQPDMSELEIQGLHEYVHKKYGAEGVGYGSIVGAGENGCILHYMENSRTQVGNNLLLMDVGAEYHGYTADVTRTIPARGKFSAEEKIIYQLVYDAQEAAFRILKEGARFADASAAASKVITNGLLRLGIIKDKADVRKYYPHGLGHHIGLDVHDRNFSQTLKKNMVITIEPGIYIPPNSHCDKKWWGIAVRIEDDALITENGYELLSRFAPRSIAGIEKMMAEKSGLEGYTLPPLQSEKKKPL